MNRKLAEGKVDASFRDEALHIPSQLLRFDRKRPATLATTQPRLPALARFIFYKQDDVRSTTSKKKKITVWGVFERKG